MNELPETARAEQVREVLRKANDEGRPYGVVVLDPLSRFAGADVEKDNAAATRFVQVLETFTSAECGSPTVIAAHHLRKPGADEDREASELIRGSSGLVDGVRFAAVLAQLKPIEGAPDLLRLRVVKSNYAAIPEPLTLCRPEDSHGVLRVATEHELEAYRELGGKRSGSAISRSELSGLILLELTKSAGSATDIARRVHKRKEDVIQTLTDLVGDGAVIHEGRKYRVPQSGSAVPGTTPGTVPRNGSEFPPPLGAEPGTGTDHVE